MYYGGGKKRLPASAQTLKGQTLYKRGWGAMRKEYIDWATVEQLVDTLLSILPRDYDIIMAITRGGLIPAALLSYRGRLHSLMVAVEQQPSDLDELFAKPTFAQFPADPLIKGKRILVVDSVWSTARSMAAVKTRIEQAGGHADLCVLHYRTADAWGDLKPDYVAEETDAWIVYPWEPPEETRIEGPAGAS
jgi:hypoxanthine phosphoribosyltransferase